MPPRSARRPNRRSRRRRYRAPEPLPERCRLKPADKRSATPARPPARHWPQTAATSRIESPRSAAEAASSTISARCRMKFQQFWRAKRRTMADADAVMPSSRSRVTDGLRRFRVRRQSADRAAEAPNSAHAPHRIRRNGEPRAAVIARLAADIVEAAQHQTALALRPRHHLQGYLGHDRKRAPGPRQQFAEVIAGDVLHHLTPGNLKLSPKPDTPCAPSKWSRAATGLDAARAGQTLRRSCRRWCRDSGVPNSRIAVFDRLERELLALGIDQRFARRPAARRPAR